MKNSSSPFPKNKTKGRKKNPKQGLRTSPNKNRLARIAFRPSISIAHCQRQLPTFKSAAMQLFPEHSQGNDVDPTIPHGSLVKNTD